MKEPWEKELARHDEYGVAPSRRNDQMSSEDQAEIIKPPAARLFHELWQSSERELCDLEARILEYANDLRRNSSGCDDYPWEYAKATADYLETLITRSRSA